MFRHLTPSSQSSLPFLCGQKIPNNFIKDHRKKILLNSVLLMVSDDKTWPMGWMISGDGQIGFQKGWPEFAQHYNLKTGQLLMFTYMGKAIFHVKIFDSNCCEINYLSLTKAVKVEKDIDESVPQDDQHSAMEEMDVLIASSNLQNMEGKILTNPCRLK